MSIHFYKKGEKNSKSLLAITDREYQLLEESFDVFEKKTGIFIDPYGKVNLYPDNLKLLNSIIIQYLPKSQKGGYDDNINLFLKQLLFLHENDMTVEVVGD